MKYFAGDFFVPSMWVKHSSIMIRYYCLKNKNGFAVFSVRCISLLVSVLENKNGFSVFNHNNAKLSCTFVKKRIEHHIRNIFTRGDLGKTGE